MTHFMRILLAHLPDVLTLTFFPLALLPVMASLSLLEEESREFSLYRVDAERLVVVRYDPNRYPLFSGPYKDWATLKTDGKQVQYGRLTPALYIVGDSVGVVEQPAEANRLYRHASLWIATGPVLVRKNEPCGKREIRNQFQHLNTDKPASRVALLLWKDGSVGFLFHRCANLWQLQRTAVRLKAYYALNLDGGSCTVWQPDKQHRLIGKEVARDTWCIGMK